MEAHDERWNEAVEDLVEAGEVDKAISLLESVVSRLEAIDVSSPQLDLRLALALNDLAGLYSSKGFSIKADDMQCRATVVKQRAAHGDTCIDVKGLEINFKEKCALLPRETILDHDTSGNWKESPDDMPCNTTPDDDWEAIADLPPEQLLSSQIQPEVVVYTRKPEVDAPKRRGRGTFSYKKQEMYSDHVSDSLSVAEVPDPVADSKQEVGIRNHGTFGTRHVLVLTGFSPSIKTRDLEMPFEDFTDGGFAIRWVNDTTALAVFQTPSSALEAMKRKKFAFCVRLLDEDDSLLASIKPRDLEPPRQRPATSATTAKRLIAHGMGIKLPSDSNAKEFRKQELARKNRIITRQNLKEDAWGDE